MTVSKEQNLSKLKFHPTDYVQPGLVAMYDGEWNSTDFAHDPHALTWKDSSPNGNDAVQRANELGVSLLPSFGSNFLQCDANGSGTFDIKHKLFEDNYQTIEVCFETASESQQWLFNARPSQSTIPFQMYINGNAQLVINIDGASFHTEYQLGTKLSMQLVRDGHLVKVFINGELKPDIIVTTADYLSQQSVATIGASGWQPSWTYSSLSFLGKIYCIRCYGRALADAELEKNYMIDEKRFRL